MSIADDPRVLQRSTALARANEIRLTNARWKHDTFQLGFVGGCQRVIEVLEMDHIPAPLGAMPIGNCLKAVNRAGDVRIRQWLRTAAIYESSKRLRDLTDRQRGALAAALLMSVERYGLRWYE